VPGAARCEQSAFFGVVACFVDESDLLLRDPLGREQRAELHVGVPSLGRSGQVTEHDLQASRRGGWLTAVRVKVRVTAALAPQARDNGRCALELALPYGAPTGHQAHVERGAAAAPGWVA
jgi:hypothetical protein